ncbi:AraC-type DNA-binding protein [Flavobacterium swingsii]|uniref:AraC-type DNA-binding protein n=1 Tax=Flavobacterium swingsii TaxID=498292 RepID=A0A1I0XHE4_9FLAO|nr:AraC-type DNA-binding protein [Flavobacterium swingsii]
MRTTLYFLLLFFTHVVFSQNKFTLTDKEYQELHIKARLLINSNLDSSFIYVNKIEKSNNNLHKSFAYGIKSYLYQLKEGDSIKSKQLYKQAFTYLDKIPTSNDKTKLNAYLLNYGGLAEWKRKNLRTALLRYEEGKKLSEKANDLKQIIKFNRNISSIYLDAGNFDLAIKVSRENDVVTDKAEYLFEVDEFYSIKSLLYLNLGSCYKKHFLFNQKNKIDLDSAVYYFKKSVVFAKYIEITRTNAQIGLANVYLLKKDYKTAQEYYNKLLIETKNKGYNYSVVNYSIGELYYKKNEFDKALVYFKKVDSIYKIDNENLEEFIYSNYFQAKIYASKKDYDNASKYSKLYLEEYKKNELKLNKEISGVNNILSFSDLNKEMIDLQKKHKNENLFKYFILLFFFSIFIFLIIKNQVDKNKANRRVKELIEEFTNKESDLYKNLNTPSNNEVKIDSDDKSVDSKNILVLDEEKEKEILIKLNILEEKLEYIKEDYTQQYVAKKIKTNTTYLSYVINKNFQKTFSEYSNGLKINYVINQMIINPTYRKYSTQAIAESVGFKNASSFTKSFNKRTGLTPVQFAKSIKL